MLVTTAMRARHRSAAPPIAGSRSVRRRLRRAAPQLRRARRAPRSPRSPGWPAADSPTTEVQECAAALPPAARAAARRPRRPPQPASLAAHPSPRPAARRSGHGSNSACPPDRRARRAFVAAARRWIAGQRRSPQGRSHPARSRRADTRPRRSPDRADPFEQNCAKDIISRMCRRVCPHALPRAAFVRPLLTGRYLSPQIGRGTTPLSHVVTTTPRTSIDLPTGRRLVDNRIGACACFSDDPICPFEPAAQVHELSVIRG
ncbi:hypothetical protein RAS1_31250 [Phycisphaerae bacterium RAS1]|nr:hypothetical protein RAS1_31250 [Phycisphaerae bacterium RAS1]